MLLYLSCRAKAERKRVFFSYILIKLLIFNFKGKIRQIVQKAQEKQFNLIKTEKQKAMNKPEYAEPMISFFPWPELYWDQLPKNRHGKTTIYYN